MTYTLIWEPAALEALKRLRQRDGDRVRPLMRAINSLAADPEPAESSKLGATNKRRLRIGVYRALYEIDGDRVAVKVLTVGSAPQR
ncbi:type II toxin-antitoxin system RelE/ParE family toxin [Actinacidiphila sp. DG2A-62]|uniref:type II toxin-antitoxin system RelE family toxin n=1 Tax=Actinacidiphila sp. DG2A-62 TaxID=3108821 RepID=UPI002DB7FBAC|nr:type II toxin-antitoxin system RelE/ParE family toxin [Actinacidiphila sp. DG2A-62]MEC3996396.1 type II toxin-antitoxin system RelE/ParE family toxin [Actinacidiphila sp. DG2A-62]